MECPCCSGKKYDVCCQPLLNGTAVAQSPEQLMRSRYTAYTLIDVDYLIQTTHPKNRKQYSRKSIKEWAESCEWLKLEVKFAQEDQVGFYAYFRESGKLMIHKEHSTFRQEDGIWYFVEGVELD